MPDHSCNIKNRRWIGLVISLSGIAVAAIVSVGCGKVGGHDDRGYAAIADEVLSELAASNDGVAKLSKPELLAHLRAKQDRLRSMDTSDDILQAIASDASAFVERYLVMAEAPDPMLGAELGLGAAAAGFFFDSPLLSTIGTETLASTTSGTLQQTREADAILSGFHGLRLRLGDLAAERAVVAAKSVPFLVEYYEGSPDDLVAFQHRDEKGFRDVTVLVKLIGKDDAQFSHAHFVKDWPASERRVAIYESGVAGLYRQTVRGVTRIDVRVIADGVLVSERTLKRPPEGWPRR